ncbi:DUF6642 family protein [Flavobacterium sp. UMI-01]|uniref:DUF6642 family protein n=1 Tax=Flavobacterium sp. UMI-01 TaxID=1441053 RepID=UPI001C7D53AB|nr:DUF6642 family protein [Flavobacterium sp. UMI-01]GIZ09437.1 hypothetical protein FUMI01_21640 [Flavobacterium sp. UMI-01]
MNQDKFIFCLEAVADVDTTTDTTTFQNLEKIAFYEGITSIHKTCDTIEGLEESLQALLYDDHHFKDYEIIYLVMPGEANSICLNNYYYSFDEIAELFEGKMKGKILHFANTKLVDLTEEEAQYFLDITGAKAVSGYGTINRQFSSLILDNAFFGLCQDGDNLIDIVESLHKKHYALYKLLDFRLYY